MQYTFKDGRFGGQHLIDGVAVSGIYEIVINKWLLIGETKYVIRSDMEEGIDREEDSLRFWSSLRFYILVITRDGLIPVTFLQLLERFDSLELVDN
jgi:hypothetical protein